MNAFKGTPGPWSVVLPANGAGNPLLCENGSNPIGELYAASYELRDGVVFNVGVDSKTRATAALIAQAPAMLQVITAIAESQPDEESVVEQARAILAALREQGAL